MRLATKSLRALALQVIAERDVAIAERDAARIEKAKLAAERAQLIENSWIEFVLLQRRNRLGVKADGADRFDGRAETYCVAGVIGFEVRRETGKE
jgi:hypothetical protein